MDRALAKRSEERFASAADFGAALQVVLDGATHLPPQLAATPPPAAVATVAMPAAASAQAPARSAREPRQPPEAPAPALAVPARRSNAAVLVGVAVAFLALGVVLALGLMKLVSKG